MRPEEYERMYSLENTYWWFQGRKEIVMRLLRRHTPLGRRFVRALDVGCGTGLLLEEISKHARAFGTDLSPLAMNFCKQRGIDRLAIARVERLPFQDDAFELILALDLLEHVHDDAALIHELWRVCKPGGHLLITVPAYSFLWSEHDEALHHFRRYSRRSLKAVIGQTDFRFVRLSNAITFMLPPIVAFRLAQRLVKFSRNGRPKTQLIRLPGLFNRLLIGMLKVEARLLEHVSFPSGVSIVALLQKPVSNLELERVLVEEEFGIRLRRRRTADATAVAAALMKLPSSCEEPRSPALPYGRGTALPSKL